MYQVKTHPLGYDSINFLGQLSILNWRFDDSHSIVKAILLNESTCQLGSIWRGLNCIDP